MSKRKICVWTVAAAGLLFLVTALLLGIPYLQAGSRMEWGNGLVLQQERGEMVLSWPESESAEYYQIRILDPGERKNTDREVYFESTVKDGCSCRLPKLPEDRPLTVRVTSASDYRLLGREKTRIGRNPLEATAVLKAPALSQLRWTANPEDKTVLVEYQMEPGDYFRAYQQMADGQKRQLCTETGTSTLFRFGGEEGHPLLENGQVYHLVFDAYRQVPGLTFYGDISGEFLLHREDFLGRELELACQMPGNNTISLQWQETKGDYYEVQRKVEGESDWSTVAKLDLAQPRSYTSPRLCPFVTYHYRVVSVGGQTLQDSPYAAISESQDITAAESVVYATIWPVTDLDVYRNTDRQEVIGTVKASRACCVLEENEDMFAVRLGDRTGYIDSRYCLINLPDYLGKLCSYNITNSYASAYMVHEYDIPRITSRMIPGYEHIRREDGSFLVPLLYPAARKLLEAGKAAAEEGYRLKIYDSFRPNKTTLSIYDLTKRVVNDPLPTKTHDGRVMSDLPEPEGEELTYKEAMTGGIYSLNFFLARGRSMHNLGIAMDLTMEDFETGEEARMQTSIHDLSFYSAVSRNNNRADLLNQIMTDAGFTGLTSEWWHFQDNESRDTLKIPTITNGLSPAGWMADDGGWRYRRENGNYYADCTAQIDGKNYIFNEFGYVLNPKN